MRTPVVRKYLAAAMLVTAFYLQPADADDPEFPGGLWLTKKKDTAVRIEACGELLCGYISWLRPDVEQQTPDGQPLCNQKVLWGFKQDNRQPELWTGGKIYKADDGKTYSGRLRLMGPDSIELRGYLGLPLIGKTYTLTRTGDSAYPQCSA